MYGYHRWLNCFSYYVVHNNRCYTIIPQQRTICGPSRISDSLASDGHRYPQSIQQQQQQQQRQRKQPHQFRVRMSSTETNQVNDAATNHIRVQKQLLRKEIRTKLKMLSSEEIAQQSRMVWDQLHAMPIYHNAKSIGLFLSMPTGEIDTSYAVQHAIQCQKEIYIPQVGKNFELPDMELIQIQTSVPSSSSSSSDRTTLPIYQNWPKNKWNIPEPPDHVIVKTATPGDIDVLVIPGLAFDRSGNRLGQGKGYYDRFMARMCGGGTNIGSSSSSSPILVAVALQCQFIGDNDDGASTETRMIPVHEHDVPVHWIILPHEVVEITK